jgi:hypothetical protein
MYVRGYLQGSENGRVVTIVSESSQGITIHQKWHFKSSLKLEGPIATKYSENAHWIPICKPQKQGVS